MEPLKIFFDYSPLHLSLETLIGTSDLICPNIESRSSIRNNQSLGLVERFTACSATPLTKLQAECFTIAPLDILVTENDGKLNFHVIELNGTGIGGLTNLPQSVLSPVLRSMSNIANQLTAPNPLVLIASSGKESENNPRLNKLIYEKLLFADVIAQEFERTHGSCHVRSLQRWQQDGLLMEQNSPLVVVDYMKELLQRLICSPDGTLSLNGRTVHAIVNDRFCANVIARFANQIDLSKLVIMNRTYLAGADKGIVYQITNEFLNEGTRRFFPDNVYYSFAHTREELIHSVIKDLNTGRKIVIKPHGTGLGNGIEFFLDPEESVDSIMRRCDASLRETEEFYGIRGGALPYTICEFLDTKTINAPQHKLDGRKYELRVVVYRDGMQLKACPAIAKVSSMPYDANAIDRQMLINNITNSMQQTNRQGSDFILPLANSANIKLLGLSEDQLEILCQNCTALVSFLLRKIEQEPTWFGLPSYGVQVNQSPTFTEIAGAVW